MEAWYVVHTRPRQEARAEEHLQRQGFHCFLPRIKQKRRRAGKRYDAIVPMFPRYIFIHLDLSGENVHLVRSTRGAIGLVHFGELLPAVPEPLIERLLQVADEKSGLIDLKEPEFQKGEKVRLEEGPLAGVAGIFEATSGRERVVILLEMLGRQQAVKVPRDSISRLR